jgi:hypothetical protein
MEELDAFQRALHKIFASKENGCKELLDKKEAIEKKIETKTKVLALPSLANSQKEAIKSEISGLEEKKKKQIEHELKECGC